MTDVLQVEFAKLAGKPAWGLCRTHGSMFFLEIGREIERGERHKPHGEWHFLIEMLYWRFQRGTRILIGSNDDKSRIDEVFDTLALDNIESVTLLSAEDLDIKFTSGISLMTFTDAVAGHWNRWTLYCPNEICWSADIGGVRQSSIRSERQ